MSVMNVYYSKSAIVIATDTFSHLKLNSQVIPVNFVSKVFQLPQFKCCFSVQGALKLAMRYFEFAQMKVTAKDFKSLIYIYIRLILS